MTRAYSTLLSEGLIYKMNILLLFVGLVPGVGGVGGGGLPW